MLPSYYGVNRCLSTWLGFQLQVVSTRSNYKPETISPVWFDYKSPVLYMVNLVFITNPVRFYHKPAQYGRSYQYSRLGLSPLLQKVGKTNNVIQCHRYDIFHIWLFLSAALVINPGYMLGIMTCPAVNRQDTLNLLYAETGWIKHDHRCLLNW